MRHTKSKTRRRRANAGIKGIPALTTEGGVPHLRHRASRVTGVYRGKQVLDVAKKLGKKVSAKSGKKTKAKEEALS